MNTLASVLNSTADLPLIAKLLIAFFAGILPVLIWLWFWEHEDKHPEPKKLIFYAFMAGMAATVLTFPAEAGVLKLFENNPDLPMWVRVNMFPIIIFIWAGIEELLKFGMAYIVVLRRKENDEPVDSMMYMITTALGFAALENAFFLFSPIHAGLGIEALMTGNMRFIGATLLHTITSGIIGIAFALTFYRSKRARRLYVSIGVITAIVLHAFFNLSIIMLNGSKPIIPFYAVWVAIVGILLAFEKVKTITK